MLQVQGDELSSPERQVEEQAEDRPVPRGLRCVALDGLEHLDDAATAWSSGVAIGAVPDALDVHRPGDGAELPSELHQRAERGEASVDRGRRQLLLDHGAAPPQRQVVGGARTTFQQQARRDVSLQLLAAHLFEEASEALQVLAVGSKRRRRATREPRLEQLVDGGSCLRSWRGGGGREELG
jgi:hypothetical protein